MHLAVTLILESLGTEWRSYLQSSALLLCVWHVHTCHSGPSIGRHSVYPSMYSSTKDSVRGELAFIVEWMNGSLWAMGRRTYPLILLSSNILSVGGDKA